MKCSNRFLCITAASGGILSRLHALVLLITLGLSSELWVQLSEGLVTEEVLEAGNERDVISLDFKQGDRGHTTFVLEFEEVSSIPVYHSLFTKGFLERKL